MKTFLLTLGILFFTSLSYAENTSSVALESAAINIHDKKAIERGGKFFAANCMVCHTMVYLRYNQVAQAAGVTYDKMPTKIVNWPNGIKPPDLSLVVAQHGVDWVYTYLHSFYLDPSRPTGFNNLLVPNSAMAGILAVYQGQQKLIAPQKNALLYGHEQQWYNLVELQSQGTMTTEQFDATITDLVTFLAYASEPYKAEQERMGMWVIGFLLVLFIFMYFLKQSYWRDLKMPKSK